MPTTGIQGVRFTDNFVTNARPQNWREGTMLLFPNGSAPLFALSAGIKSSMTDDPRFNWWEKEMTTQRIALTADAGTGATLTFAANAARDMGLQVGHILRIEETGELVRVTVPVATSTTVTVARSVGSFPATTIDFDGAGVNPNVHVVGIQMEENSSAPGGVSLDPVQAFNFTQIFRNTFQASRTAINTRLRTGEQVKEAKRETLENHSAAIEKAFFWGEPVEGAIGGDVARLTGGVLDFIPAANKTTFTAAVTWANILTELEQAFRFGSSQKMGFLGNLAMLTIQEAVRLSLGSTVNIMHGDNAFGMNITRLVTPFGEIMLKTHPLFNQITSGITTAVAYDAYDASLVILDMENLHYRYLRNSDTQYQPKLAANDLDGVQSGYLTECGLEVHHPTTHYEIQGLSSAAAG